MEVSSWVKAGMRMNDRMEIENCYRQMYRGMIGKDRRALAEVLDDSFALMHMTGMRQSKEAFIRAVENGTLNYSSAEHQRMDVEIRGDGAALLGRSVVRAAVFSGGWHTWRLQLDLALAKRDGAWRIIAARTSTY